ncbi:alanine racemase [Siccirubricoccus sp. KC 17139]|uniref:Alanine racemase n=1 Tax=Siccirubricoccus soli TaxID=2899147 RepID=A0ABT1DBM8_9PROT|nr:alanine racemase [Siccirubricoccus soli]MCO6419334.1 alanine racemase [Siccirubricoccus soli]MCP2685469.1 alanine racemase [Siccirubricoccus soli]
MPFPSRAGVAMQAVLTIDLGAIAANWAMLRDRMAPGLVAGVVKADGYGLGAAPVGRALLAAGCRHFFVAHLAEGMALRAVLGPGPMIAVLNGFAPGADEDAALVPVLNGLPDLAAHAAAGRRRPVILHVDTGMSRLGLDARELELLAAEPGRLGPLELRYVMTHLAVADTPAHPLNAAQAARFAAARARLPAAPFSFANSSGCFLGPDFASDLSRPGCALYGVNPTPGAPNPMRQAVTLAAPILQVRDIPAGETVGYGATWRATRPSRIATVAAGYADGYLRALSGRAVGILAGRPAPLIGRVSMDLITFDVTDAPACHPGEMIQLIGPGNTPDEVAERAGTIGYEILTSLGARYRRDYLGA